MPQEQKNRKNKSVEKAKVEGKKKQWYGLAGPIISREIEDVSLTFRI